MRTTQKSAGKSKKNFLPSKRSCKIGSGHVSEALKQAIRASGKTPYQIAQDAGISEAVLSRFLTGERDIRMATADKLAEALVLKFAAQV